MSLLKSFQQSVRKGADFRIYGPGGSRRSTRLQRIALSGSTFDYAAAAGPLYDNGVVLPAINWKANAIGEAELIVQQFNPAKAKWERSIEKGPVSAVLKAFNLPNDYYDGLTLWQGVQLSWDTRGNSYLYRRVDNMGRTIGFYWIPHLQIRPLADIDNDDGTKLVTRYEYIPLNGGIQYLDPSEVVHFRYGIDPKDPASGLSPLAAQLRDICTDNEVSTWLASILRQGATPGAILSPKMEVKAPTPQQKLDLRELWNSFVGDKRGEAFMSPLPIDVITPTWSPQQMELGALRDVPMVRIMASLGLDPMVLGFASEKQTFANKEQAIDDAGKRTILPSIKRWAMQASQQVLPDFKLDPETYRLSWDVSGVSWLLDDVDSLHKRIRDDYKAGVIDRWTAKEQMGLEPEESDKDVYAIPLQLSDGPDATDSKKSVLRAISRRSQERRRAYEINGSS